MEEGFTSIRFFLVTGRTFTFRNVTRVVDNETAISFHYTAMSDGKEKDATFYKMQIEGVAYLK